MAENESTTGGGGAQGPSAEERIEQAKAHGHRAYVTPNGTTDTWEILWPGAIPKLMDEHAHDAVVAERIATGKRWREAFKAAPIPLNVTVPQTPGNHEKALRRIFAAFMERPAQERARAEKAERERAEARALLREIVREHGMESPKIDALLGAEPGEANGG